MIGPLDRGLVHLARNLTVPVARFGLFVIFFWFGLLKLLGMSPAAGLVRNLYTQTISFMSFDVFFMLFAAFECLIGILFLIKGTERVVIPLLFIHMAMTFMPLFMLPEITWQAPFVPTLEGQYIIKNLAIIASALAIAAHMHPVRRSIGS
ncbi:MAG: hypothetical protein AAB458_01870 [Patescibacteria group bacterium]